MAARAADLATVLFLQLGMVVLAARPLSDTTARVLFVALLAAYELLFLAARGQTPGRDLLGVRVAAAGTGDRPGLGRALRRLPVLALLLLEPTVAAVAAALVVVTLALPGRRGVHDRVAGTWVVAADDDEPPPRRNLEPLDELRRRRRLLG